MINVIKAELRVLCRRKIIIASTCVYVVFFLLMYFQKVINVGSGFYQRDIITPFYMIAFFEALLCVTSQLYFSIVAGVIGGDSFEHNTMASSIITVGRCKIVGAKVLSYICVALFFSMMISLLGIATGVCVCNSFADFSVFLFLKYIIVSALYTSLEGLGAFLIAFFTKNTFVGIIGNVIAALGLSFLGSYIPKLYKLLSGNYAFAIVSSTYKILEERNDMQLIIHSVGDSVFSYIYCIMMFLVTYLVVMFLSVKREYLV